MRNVFSLFRRGVRRRPERPPNVGWYRSESCRPLSAGQVRDRRFRQVKRGLDPIEVHGFLYRVAGELALARREVAITAEENLRIKRALRAWQSRQSSGAR
ncbi:DivIVA domain-containing protein [Micromonospora sp. NPDC000089]|uniref:DivIVA domain-containing protein n=1 Tax=unclassified Micromonospora TaxID=2617518 RepID=UPI003694BB22